MPLEARLERLVRLHRDGELDDAEFRVAKAAVLSGTGGAAADGGPAGAVPAGAVPAGGGRVPVRGLVLCLGVMAGFTLAALSSAFTGLQAPAGRFVCGDDPFVAGRHIERAGSETTFDIDSACRRADGTLDHLSQLRVLGVLTAIYTPGALLCCWGVSRLLRSSSTSEHAEAPAVLVGR